MSNAYNSSFTGVQIDSAITNTSDFIVKEDTDIWYAPLNHNHYNDIGISIPENADFNTYTTIGKYFTASNDRAATVINCPAAMAGILTVSNPIGSNLNPLTAWYYVLLTYENYNGTSIYKRLGYTSDTSGTFSWDAWKKYCSTDSIYPIGAIYMSVSDVNPSTLFGGTWELILNTFLLAAGSNYAAGTTGGEATHTLTATEMPYHNHGLVRLLWYSSDVVVNSASGTIYSWKSGTGGTTSASYKDTGEGGTLSAGGGGAHNNMPPYLAVYMWKRTA